MDGRYSSPVCFFYYVGWGTQPDNNPNKDIGEAYPYQQEEVY